MSNLPSLSLLGSFVLLNSLLISPVIAQIVDVRVETERRQFLLFEPLPVRITVQNNSGSPLHFESTTPERPWLSFLIRAANQDIVRPDLQQQFEPLTLQVDQARSLVVNVTPLYAFRSTGPYRLRAVVELEGRQFVSAPLEFTIAAGHKIWSTKRTVDASIRLYSLLRFSPSPETTTLYLRVEDEQENLVYATTPLGEVVSLTEPQVQFDRAGKMHIIHVNGSGSYQYTRADRDGIIENKEPFVSVNRSQPTLLPSQDGSILVVGGRSDNEKQRRELLSEGQRVIRRASPAAAAAAE